MSKIMATMDVTFKHTLNSLGGAHGSLESIKQPPTRARHRFQVRARHRFQDPFLPFLYSYKAPSKGA